MERVEADQAEDRASADLVKLRAEACRALETWENYGGGASYLQRTEWNVRDSDGTVIFTIAAKLARGSKRTAEFAKKHGKPLLHISYAGSHERPGERLAAFVKQALEEAFYPRVEAMVVQ